jgi:predicted permease
MDLDLLTVLLNIGILILIGVPGYVFGKAGLLKGQDSKPLSALLIYVAQPFMIIMSYQGKIYHPDILGSLGITILLAAVAHLAMLLVAHFAFSFTKAEKAQKGILIFCSAFANCGYMGIPVIKLLFAQSPNLAEMLIYLSMYITVFNLLNWTIGIYIISGNKKFISIKNAFINPATISIFIGLVLFFAKININAASPEIANAFNLLGDMTIPLSMIILGMKLAEIPFKEIFSSKYIYITVFIKLIIMPLFAFGITYLLRGVISELVIYIVVIIAAMPVATNSVANADRFGGDSLSAAKAMLCSTLLCVITLPLVTLLLKLL